jgi:hypothetical protein
MNIANKFRFRQNATKLLLSEYQDLRKGSVPWSSMQSQYHLLNIKLDLKELGCESEVWLRLAQYRVHWWDTVNTAMNFQIPKRQKIHWPTELVPTIERLHCFGLSRYSSQNYEENHETTMSNRRFGRDSNKISLEHKSKDRYMQILDHDKKCHTDRS